MSAETCAGSTPMFGTTIKHIRIRVLEDHTTLVPSVDADCRKHGAELALEQPLHCRCSTTKGTTERIHYIVVIPVRNHPVVPLATSPTPAHVRGHAHAHLLHPLLRSDGEDCMPKCVPKEPAPEPEVNGAEFHETRAVLLLCPQFALAALF